MITISEATAEDIKTIQEITYITWPITYGNILSGEQLDYMLDLIYSDEALTNQFKKKEQLFYLISEDEKTLGFIGIEHNYKNEAVTRIHKIYLLISEVSLKSLLTLCFYPTNVFLFLQEAFLT